MSGRLPMPKVRSYEVEMGIVRFLTRADTWLDVAWRWGTAFGAAWFGISWLAGHMTSFGDLNLADAIAVGLGGAMLLSVVVSLALIAIRYFRPLPNGLREKGTENAESASGAPAPSNFGDTELREQISGISEQIAQLLQRLVDIDAANCALSSELRLLQEARALPLAIEELEELMGKLHQFLSGEVATWAPELKKEYYMWADGLGLLLHSMGVATVHDYDSLVSKQIAEIKGDAINCTVQPEEAGQYKSGPEKQSYMIMKARVEIAQRKVNVLLQELVKRQKREAQELKWGAISFLTDIAVDR